MQPIYLSNLCRLSLRGCVIADLDKADPPLIIYSSDYWSYAIDGRSMQDRYRKLDAYLREAFPIKICKGDYCIREKP